MRRWLERIVTGGMFAGIIAACLAYWAYRQTRTVPDFYEQAALTMPADVGQASEQLQRQVQELQDQVGRTGSWQATFSDAQINAWLVRALPLTFPKLLPSGVQEPRVMIENGRLRAAAQYKDRRIETVVSFEVAVELTDQPNVLAVRINNLRAGALPLPLERFLKGISREAAKSDLEVRWDETESGPVALVTIPSDHESFVRTPVIVESVALGGGELSLEGHTGPEARRTFRPRGPVYQLASLTQPRSSDSDNRIIQASSRSSSAEPRSETR